MKERSSDGANIMEAWTELAIFSKVTTCRLAQFQQS